MKTQKFEWICPPLQPEQLQSVLESLPLVLMDCSGDCLITAMYGWGCNLHTDLCYVPMKVATKWIDRFIRDSLEQRIFVPADSDLSFELPDERIRLLFCHEGDIHVSGSDDELLEKLLASAPFKELSFTRYRKGAKQSVQPVASGEGVIQDGAQQLIALEHQRLRALVEADIPAASLLHADDFQLINPLGGSLSKDQYLGAIAAGDIDYVEWKPEAIEVKLYGDAAVLRYQAEIKIKVKAMPDAPSGRFWHTDLYERRNGRWQVVWSQATQIQ